MAEHKWTPGPWTVFDEESTLEVDFDGNVIKPIVHWTGFDSAFGPDNRKRANAHLIAAAPDLYEALDSLQAALTHPGNRDLEYWIRARAALAKARGESQ